MEARWTKEAYKTWLFDTEDENNSGQQQRELNAFGDPVPTAAEMIAMEEEGRLLLAQTESPTPAEYPSPRSSNYGEEDEGWRYLTNRHLTPPRRSP